MFIRYHGKGRRVVEHMVVFVKMPPIVEVMAAPVVEKLPEIGQDPNRQKIPNLDLPAVRDPAVRLGVSMGGQIKSKRWAHRCGASRLDRLQDLISNFFRLRKLWVVFVLPGIVCWIDIEPQEKAQRHDQNCDRRRH